jgi:Protein of unknown function, DUF481
MRCFTRLPLLLISFLCGVSGLRPLAAQPAANKPQPDVLILIDGERVVGHFTGATAKSVSFKSDLLGDVTADWSKVKELHTQGEYAVLRKEVQLRPHMETSNIPQGTIEASGQTITLRRGETAQQTVSVADAATVMEEAKFQKQVSPPSIPLWEDWGGTITGAGTLVEATQQSVLFTGAVHLARAIPVETDFPPRNRTTFDFVGSEGHETQKGTPEIKTEIFHAGAERDQYFSLSGVYGFVQGAFDHNFSQGLTLQQNYAGGVGWTIIRQPNETFDVKAGVDYVRQQFTSGPDQNLAGSNFGESFLRKFADGASFSEQLGVTPSWNNLHALLATGNATITLPVYKRLAFTLSILDSFLNNPPPSFHKNSYQATTGISYSLK